MLIQHPSILVVIPLNFVRKSLLQMMGLIHQHYHFLYPPREC